jgi:hypothetical protein
VRRGAAAVLGVVPGLLLGAVVGIASVALHQSWGFLVLIVAAVFAALRALPAGWARGGFAVGFALVVLRSMLPRPEGDYMIASNASGYALLVLTLVLVVVTIATLPRPGRRPVTSPVP